MKPSGRSAPFHSVCRQLGGMLWNVLIQRRASTPIYVVLLLSVFNDIGHFSYYITNFLPKTSSFANWRTFPYIVLSTGATSGRSLHLANTQQHVSGIRLGAPLQPALQLLPTEAGQKQGTFAVTLILNSVALLERRKCSSPNLLIT